MHTRGVRIFELYYEYLGEIETEWILIMAQKLRSKIS